MAQPSAVHASSATVDGFFFVAIFSGGLGGCASSACSGFVVRNPNTGATYGFLSGSPGGAGATMLVGSLAAVVKPGEPLVLDYAGSGLLDTGGGTLAGFTGFAINNLTPPVTNLVPTSITVSGTSFVSSWPRLIGGCPGGVCQGLVVRDTGSGTVFTLSELRSPISRSAT